MRTYEVNPSLFGVPITLYMECTENKERTNGQYYWCYIYFSVENYGIRDFVYGTTFGERVLRKDEIDVAIDALAEQVLTYEEDVFKEYIRDYIEKEDFWEQELERRYREQNEGQTE